MSIFIAFNEYQEKDIIHDDELTIHSTIIFNLSLSTCVYLFAVLYYLHFLGEGKYSSMYALVVQCVPCVVCVLCVVCIYLHMFHSTLCTSNIEASIGTNDREKERCHYV